MLRYGYDRRVATGVIAASGTLAQIIPPSLVLIVLADQLGRSVGDMYEGAFVPGLVLTALYAGYILLMTLVYPQSAPALPLEARTIREPGGGSGIPSLVAAALATVAMGYAANWYFEPRLTTGAGVLAVTMAISLVFLAAVANRYLHLGLL